jgi:hypothetical protein
MKVDRVGEVWKWAEGDSHWRITKSDGMDNWWCKDQFGADGILPERSIARMILVSPPANADASVYPFTETTLDPMLAGLSQTTGRGKIVSEKITAAHERFACKENPETLHVDRNFYTQLADKCGELEAQLSVAVDHAETISLKYDRLRSFVHSKTLSAFDAIEKKRGAK